MKRGRDTESASRRRSEAVVKGAIAVWSAVAISGEAMAGGLAIREQSASAQGASFAGAAAGGDLSASFWNPAAMSSAGYGLTSESHYALIHADFDVQAESVSVLPGSALPASTTLVDDRIQIDPLALVGSSYAAWRANDRLVLGLSITSPFGSKNKADNATWAGQYHYRSSELFTINVNPIASYQLTPHLSFGAGPQIQYLSLTIKANPSGGLAPPQSTSALDGDDIGVGFTAGMMWQPVSGTDIGVGFRSAVSHEVDGVARLASGYLTTGTMLGTVPFKSVDFKAKLQTPEIATLSLRQAMGQDTRLLGSVEWSNWSRLDQVDFIAQSTGGIAAQPVTPGHTLNVLDFHWNDGWFFALGGEWDYTKELTLRAGAAYEISPIRDADQRKINVADSDRVWLSLGATYAFSATTAFDFAYTHIFFDDAPIDSLTTTPAGPTAPVRRFVGYADQSADIIAMSLKTKW